MRMFVTALALVAALSLAAPFATAVSAAGVTLTAKESACPTGKTFCFDASASTLSAGENTITLNNPSTNAAPHNVCVKVGTTETCKPARDQNVDPGGEATLTFTAPAGSTVEYWCEPHKTIGMTGTFTVQGAAPSPTPTPTPTPTPSPSPGDSGTKGSPDVGLLSIALGVGLLAVVLRRRGA